jgi:hypothetical protein
MATFKEVIEIRDKPWNRAVKVTIIAPSLKGLDVQALAQKA